MIVSIMHPMEQYLCQQPMMIQLDLRYHRLMGPQCDRRRVHGPDHSGLDKGPLTDVVISVASSDTGEATVSNSTLTFTARTGIQPRP